MVQEFFFNQSGRVAAKYRSKETQVTLQPNWELFMLLFRLPGQQKLAALFSRDTLCINKHKRE